MEQSSSKAAAASLTLQRLLNTHQATTVLPGVLYFATTGECLSSCLSTTAASASKAETCPAAAAASPTASINAALRDFFLAENPWVEENCATGKGDGAAGERSCSRSPRRNNNSRSSNVTIPPTSAAVGTDAVFVAPRDTPPYLYRSFFADFGPLDLGCCMHFARRLRALLRAVATVTTTADATSGRLAEHDSSASAGSAKAMNTSTTNVFSSSGGGNDNNNSNGNTASCGSEGINGIACGVTSLRSHEEAALASSSSSSSASPLRSKAATTLPIVVCASLNAQERVNTACLVGAFCVLVLGWSAAATWSRVFAEVYPSFPTYRDASAGVSNYPLSLQDVWTGLELAGQLGWVSVDTFDLPAYWEGKAKDFSWIVPRRLVAMSSPRDAEPQRTAAVFARRLHAMNVRLVIRLNDNLYSPSPLLRLGIRHVDLPYADGSTPNDATLLRFLQVVEEYFGEQAPSSPLRQWWSVPTVTGLAGSDNTSSAKHKKKRKERGGQRTSVRPETQYALCSLLHSGKLRGMPDTRTAITTEAPSAGELGAVAVHCLAGLGRTGTMIAVYIMRHYGFTARGVIGWMRLCRPGSITGVQQQYLDTIERRLRPSPYVFATQRLKDFVQTLQSTLRSSLSPSSSVAATSAAAPSDTDSVRSAATAQRSLDGGASTVRMGACGESVSTRLLTSAAGGTSAYQVHGNVVGDARPLTRLGSGGSLARRRESGQWGEASSSSGLQGLLLRRSPQQQQRRRSSTSSLSFSTEYEDIAGLDAVSSMPVLGEATNERPRSTNHSSDARTTTITAATTAMTATACELPHAGDYKYVSTYFVALERANQRSPLRNPNSSSDNIDGTTSASSSRSPYPARRKLSSATIAVRSGAGNGTSSATRATTAGTTLVRRSSRLDGPDRLSRDHPFHRKPSLPSQRRVSSMKVVPLKDVAGASSSSSTTTSARWSAADKSDRRPYTTTAVHATASLGALDRLPPHDAPLRLRKTQPTPTRPPLSFRSSVFPVGLLCDVAAEAEAEEELLPALTTGGVRARGAVHGSPRSRSPSPWSAVIPETVLPLWGRPVGRA